MGAVYTPAAHGWSGVAVAFFDTVCGAESDPRKNRGCPGMGSECAAWKNPGLLTLFNDGSQRFTVLGILCDRLAKVE